jgi:hypothetical protein
MAGFVIVATPCICIFRGVIQKGEKERESSLCLRAQALLIMAASSEFEQTTVVGKRKRFELMEEWDDKLLGKSG